MKTKHAALFFCLILAACTGDVPPEQLPAREMQITTGQTISIRIDEGEILVQGGGDDGSVTIGGQLFLPEETTYSATSEVDQIQITSEHEGFRSSVAPIRMNVTVPNNVRIKIESDFASITVRDYEGELETASVAGDILIENSQGTITARSNRGDVTVRNSAGNISVVGNYGLLTLDGSKGDIGVSTIMGTITFNGLIHADDDVRLETDHGPVDVNLEADSALTLSARSTSGDLACMLPGIDSSTRWCEGQFGAGGGALQIRTVSGAVWIRLIP